MLTALNLYHSTTSTNTAYVLLLNSIFLQPVISATGKSNSTLSN